MKETLPFFVGTKFPCKHVNAITFLNHVIERKRCTDKNRTKLKKNLKYVSVDTFLYQGVSFFFLLKNKK